MGKNPLKSIEKEVKRTTKRVGKEVKRSVKKTGRQVERSAGDVALLAVNPMLGAQALLGKKGVSKLTEAMAPDLPDIPEIEEVEEIEEEEEEKAEEEAEERGMELKRRSVQQGRFSTLHTAPLGRAGLGGVRTMLDTLLGRR